MKKLVAFVSSVLAMLVLATDVLAGQVRGYYRKDGTYVQPHQRSNPDGKPYNNYNFPGNYNPNTGRITPGDPNRYLDRYYRDRSPYRSNPYGLSDPNGDD